MFQGSSFQFSSTAQQTEDGFPQEIVSSGQEILSLAVVSGRFTQFDLDNIAIYGNRDC